MAGYLRSAINAIYGEDDDFILLGLTGRTGSGCSTVAKILQSESNDITNSLYHGDSPTTNDQRKQKIIYKHFSKTWVPFQLIQVRSVITLMLVECGIDAAVSRLASIGIGDSEKLSRFKLLLEKIKTEYDLANSSNDNSRNINFYIMHLPIACDEIKKLLGESESVIFYQDVGKNIRLSGNPYDDKLSSGKFFSLAERINKIVIKVHNLNKSEGGKSLIVIDAIRSPLEAIYFQDRYASFHLVAVSCPDEERNQD